MKETFIKYKIIIFISGALFFIGIIVGGGAYYLISEKNIAQKIPDNIILEEKEEETTVYYMVDIKGEVNKPGTYQVEETKRVIDVIKLAGGLTKDANTSANNLSKKISDEMVIIIYSKQQIASFKETKKIEEEINIKCNEENNNVTNQSCIKNNNEVEEEKKEETSDLISISTATKEQLMELPGIGESKALSIIEYRTQNGLFIKIEDIKNVTGIGDSIYDQIKKLITI